MNSSDLWSEPNINNCFDFVNSSCPKSNRSLTSYSTMCFVMFGAIILTIVGNLVVIISVSHFKQLHTPTNFLILSLAITDFLLGLLVMPYSMVRSITSCWYFGDIFCKIHSCFDMMLCTTSIFHLFFISVDRYYAVCHPLHYFRIITTSVVEVCLFISWSVPCIYAFGVVFSNVNVEGIQDYVASVSCIGSCSLLFNKLWAAIVTLISFFIPGALMIGIYVHIFSVARKQAKLIHNHTKSKRSLKGESKAAKTLSIVMGVFILCWLPFFTVTVVDPHLNFSTSEDIYNAVLWLGYINSTLNPIIYALFYPWFRKSVGFIMTGNIFNVDSSSLNVSLKV
ncbi:trace amine-associated receptor 4-like [Ascaphus truei]|uniref:trace amine-associated receptor 4-like n=1 Tax=Ascaphus truei TaxID=8439 RepID=UPI003F5A9268